MTVIKGIKEHEVENSSACSMGSCSATGKANQAEHWNQAFARSAEEQLGWYEKDVSASMQLIEAADLSTGARILVAGAGNSRLLDELIRQGYTNLLASDISETALDQLHDRLGNKIEYIVDDLTNPTLLNDIEPVDLWFDRAVLHFFKEQSQQDNYHTLINQKVRMGGYIALAEFAEDGATRCSGLDVRRYSIGDMQQFLGEEFILMKNFKHLYTMPTGDTRKYNYALFQRQ